MSYADEALIYIRKLTEQVEAKARSYAILRDVEANKVGLWFSDLADMLRAATAQDQEPATLAPVSYLAIPAQDARVGMIVQVSDVAGKPVDCRIKSMMRTVYSAEEEGIGTLNDNVLIVFSLPVGRDIKRTYRVQEPLKMKIPHWP